MNLIALFKLYIICTCLFLLYIQFSPDMGNIWWRNGKFVPSNAIRLMIHPLSHSYMWSFRQMWIINYFVWLFLLFSIICIHDMQK